MSSEKTTKSKSDEAELVHSSRSGRNFKWVPSEKTENGKSAETKLFGYTHTDNEKPRLVGYIHSPDDKVYDEPKLVGYIHTNGQEVTKPKLLGHIITPRAPAVRHNTRAGSDHRLSQNFKKRERTWVRIDGKAPEA